MKINSKHIAWMLSLFIMASFLIFACSKSTTSPAHKPTTVRFAFDATGQPSGNTLIRPIIKKQIEQLTPGNRAIGSHTTAGFNKPNRVDEAKVLVLDMTQWPTWEEFITAWDSTSQTAFWDTTLWDSTKDFWDNWSVILHSYTGEFYHFAGEYDLTIRDSVATGIINVNPGLNYFLLCLRENGQTVFWEELTPIIMEGEENTLHLHATSAVYVEIYSPQDSMVYQQGAPIIFQGWAEDQLNYEDIPDSNYVWSSDKDGQLGKGSFLERSDLSVNQHTITLTATTRGGVSGSKQVHITVTP